MSPRDLFPDAHFSPPATEDQVVAVEKELGVRLPDQLRRLYLDCDGFRENRGNSKYLLSLTDEDSVGSLLKTKSFWWDEWRKYHPKLNLRPFVFFGFSSSGESWAIDWKRGDKIIAYHYHMLDEYEIVGSDILELWRSNYAKYRETGDA